MYQRIIKTTTNPYFLIAVNIALIFAIELIGGGTWFVRTGLIHGVAILFVLFSLLVIFIPYPLYDPIAKKFIISSMIAMLIFGFSHFLEFVSFRLLQLPSEAVYVNVANLYIISILVILIGVELFLKTHLHHSSARVILYGAGILLFIGMAIAVSFQPELIDLEGFTPTVAFYLITSSTATFIGVRNLIKMRKVSILVPFINYLAVALGFIFLAVLINIFSDAIRNTLLISGIQIVNLAHFVFYAALSVMIASFSNLSKTLQNLGGIYQDLRNEKGKEQG